MSQVIVIRASEPNLAGNPLPVTVIGEPDMPDDGVSNIAGVWAATGTPKVRHTSINEIMSARRNLMIFIRTSFNPLLRKVTFPNCTISSNHNPALSR